MNTAVKLLQRIAAAIERASRRRNPSPTCAHCGSPGAVYPLPEGLICAPCYYSDGGERAGAGADFAQHKTKGQNMKIEVTVTGVQRDVNAAGEAYGQRIQACGVDAVLDIRLPNDARFGEFLPGRKVLVTLDAVFE